MQTKYEDWVEQWKPALEAFPQRVGRGEGFQYRGAVAYAGPMCFVDPALAVDAGREPAREARRVAPDDVQGHERAKF